MLETLLENPVAWFAASGPEAEVVVSCQGRLYRNLADFPFPGRCSEDEKVAVEGRVLDVLKQAAFLEKGQYCRLNEMDASEVGLLDERGLVDEELRKATGARGVYVSDDQSLSIMANGANHLTVQVIASGLQPQEIWTRLSEVDNTLASVLDYAYDDKLGFLTSSLSHVGTGLRFAAKVHVPGLVLTNRIPALTAQLREAWHLFEGMSGKGTPALGDFYRVTNRSTLGQSEEELAFHLRHSTEQIVAEERAARESIGGEDYSVLEDRVGRALGIARRARLLESDEAVALLSSLRLGLATGLLQGYSLEQLNELMVTSQQAHLQMRHGEACDGLALSKDRADLFRARFS
ncbi:MAG: hypothetical protein GY851_07140 [bacterium]|nr:hypothetical protein [bacterium]